MLLRPAGYPLKSIFQEHPVVSDPKLFELYAQEQWYGEALKPGCYLFDRRLYPDFAFQVVKVHPRHSVVGTETTIKVEQKAEPKNKMKFDVSFDDVIGQETAKRKVKIVEKFLQDPEKFGRWAPRNILFYGVSGTGKTMIAKALSAEAGVPMLAVKSTSLIGEFVGEGARQIHNLYDKAEEMAPCIIFIDELDAIALDRRYQDLRGDVSEIVNSLLTEMDGISNRLGVCTIAATNQIEVLDASVRSRFEEEIEFKLPNLEERLKLLEKNAATLPLELENVRLARDRPADGRLLRARPCGKGSEGSAAPCHHGREQHHAKASGRDHSQSPEGIQAASQRDVLLKGRPFVLLSELAIDATCGRIF